jgi:citrate lyase gamma subunit
MDPSKENENNPFSSLRNELSRLKGVLQRIDQSIAAEGKNLPEDPAAPAKMISQDLQIAVQPNETKTVRVESETTVPDHEKSLDETILELENQIRVKEWLLKTRDAQIKKLRSELVEAKLSLMTEEKDKWDGHGWRKLWKQAVGS